MADAEDAFHCPRFHDELLRLLWLLQGNGSRDALRHDRAQAIGLSQEGHGGWRV